MVALIFLYEIKEEHKEVLYQALQDTSKQGMLEELQPVFVKQKISNACGTIAILHALLNTVNHVGGAVEGSFLDRFLKETEGKNGDERGEFVNQSKELEEMHLKHAVKGSQETINTEAKCHYVTYILGKDGKWVVELDGRRPSPVVKTECPSMEVFHLSVSDIIQGYIEISNKMNVKP